MDNRNISLFIVSVIFFTNIAAAKHHSYLYTHLSAVYDFRLSYDVIDSDDRKFVRNAHISIINKSDKIVVQRIRSFFDEGPIDYAFNCTSRSFTTGFNKNVDAIDGDWGDIIVADFNFDGKEDFAVRTGAPGMGAPYEPCDFYIQNSNGKFVKDEYLSSEVQCFPDKIDSQTHTLSMVIAVGANPEVYKHIYKYNSKTHKWAGKKIRVH